MKEENNNVEVSEEKDNEKVGLSESEKVEEGVIDIDMSQQNSKRGFIISVIAVGIAAVAILAIVIALQDKDNDNGNNIRRSYNISASGNAKSEADTSSSVVADVEPSTEPMATKTSVLSNSQAQATTRASDIDSDSKEDATKTDSKKKENADTSKQSENTSKDDQNTKKTSIKVDIKEFNKKYIMSIEDENKEWLIDMDGDGKDDKVSYKLIIDNNQESRLYEVLVNGKVAFSKKSLSCDIRFNFNIVDMNKDDNKYELLIGHDCYEAPYYYVIYSYKDGKFVKKAVFMRMEEVDYPMTNINDTAGLFMSDYQIDFSDRCVSLSSIYNSETNKIDIINNDGVIDLKTMNCELQKDVTLYSSADLSSSKVKLSKQTIKVSKLYVPDPRKSLDEYSVLNDYWIYVTATDKTSGWIYLKSVDGQSIIDDCNAWEVIY